MRTKELIRDSFPDVGKTVSLGRRRRWERQLTRSIERAPEEWPIACDLLDVLRGVRNVQVITYGTRRSAKTGTIGRALGSLMVANDGFVVRCLGRTLQQMAENFWESEGDGGFIGMLDEIGIPYQAVRTGGLLHAIRFPWGAAAVFHPCETISQIKLVRGKEADAYWIDEAQDLPLIGPLLLEVVSAARIKRKAALILSGTPDEHMDGMFYGAIDSPKWSTHRLSVWRNPYIPGGSAEARWAGAVEIAVDALGELYGVTKAQVDALLRLTPDDLDAILAGNAPIHARPLLARDSALCLPPAIQRELLGLWVASVELYVHPVERWQDTLYWCRGVNVHRVQADDALPVYQRWQDRVRMLPKGRQWEILIGYDLGYGQDPCAMWVGALDRATGTVYELHSYKERLVGEDAQIGPLRSWLTEARALFATCAHRVRSWTVVMDASEGTGDAWNHKLTLHAGLQGVTVIPAKKQNKLLQISEMNLILADGRLKCVAGDPVDLEQRYLQWEPKPAEKERVRKPWKYRPVTLPDGTRCAEGTPQGPLGDHALDARRYAVITGYVLAGNENEQPQSKTEATVNRLLRR